MISNNAIIKNLFFRAMSLVAPQIDGIEFAHSRFHKQYTSPNTDKPMPPHTTHCPIKVKSVFWILSKHNIINASNIPVIMQALPNITFDIIFPFLSSASPLYENNIHIFCVQTDDKAAQQNYGNTTAHNRKAIKSIKNRCKRKQ